MPNTLITPSWVMKEVTRLLVNNLKFASAVNRDYDNQYVQGGAKVGYTVNARLPQQYIVSKGQTVTATGVTDRIVPITLTDQANVAIEFSTASETMEVDDYRDRYIMPAVAALANTVDNDGLTRMYKQTWWTTGTPGVTPGSTGTLPFAANLAYMQATTKLTNYAVPVDGRVAVLSPEMQQYLSAAQFLNFNPGGQISDFFRNGMFGRKALGIDEWFMDQNVATHTIGLLGGTPRINGANQTGTSINTDGWTASTQVLNEGDVVQFAGCRTVNPQNRQSTGQLNDFVVAADVTSNGSGEAVIPLYTPNALTTAGVFQTVDASPADNALISVFGIAQAGQAAISGTQTRQGMVFHPDAYTLVMADLEVPKNQWIAERISNRQLGISIRFVKGYNTETDQSLARLDILYGWAAVRPEMGSRVAA